MNFKELDKNGSVEGFALVKSCDKKSAKNGSVYLDLTLADKTGEINAKIWDYREGAFLPEANTVIKVRGVLSSYNGTPQMKIERSRAVWDSDGVNMRSLKNSFRHCSTNIRTECLTVRRRSDFTMR